MQPKQTIKMLLILLIWTGCKQKKNDAAVLSATSTNTTTTYPSSPQPTDETQVYTITPAEEPVYYDDGVYCASVRYTNNNTGNSSIYMLNVEVEDGKLTKINWPNGGWLDETHFTPPHINQSGFTSFVADKGYGYDVLIKSAGKCDYSTSNTFNTYSDTRSYSTNSTDEELEENEEAKLENEYGSVQAVVYKRVSGCDYMILEERGDYYVAEWMGRYDPNEGDRIQGDIRHYGTKTCYVRNKDRESRLYIEDYRISLSRAWEIIRDKCNLEDREEN